MFPHYSSTFISTFITIKKSQWFFLKLVLNYLINVIIIIQQGFIKLEPCDKQSLFGINHLVIRARFSMNNEQFIMSIFKVWQLLCFNFM